MTKLTRDEKHETPIDRFHEHLDKCERCRNNPFDFCATGYFLLHQVDIQNHNEVRRKEYSR